MRIIQLKDQMLKGVVGGGASVTFDYNAAGQPDHILVELTKGDGIAVLVDRSIGDPNRSAVDGGGSLGGSVSPIMTAVL